MRHSQLVNTEARTDEAWVERFFVSGDAKDRELLRYAIDEIFRATHTRDPLQPCSLDIAEILRHLDVDQTTLIASLLCDPCLLPVLDINDIRKDYGDTIAVIVEDMRNLQRFQETLETIDTGETSHRQAEQLRRMLLAMMNDLRSVLLKLAWNLQYLRLLARSENDDLRRYVARYTMELYAPLANRLGISQIKWEMEDLAFRFLQPEEYKQIASSLADKRIERERFIAGFTEEVKGLLREHGIHAEVYGRPKHIYSIWRKQKRKGVPIEKLYDLRAVRIIVDDTDTCYHVIGHIHEHWIHISDEYDDYIANKKSNGYQSIHTVVAGPQGKHVEIQVRTREMHQFAELGVAAHWRYKEGGKQDQAIERTIASLRKMLESNENDAELLEDFRTEAFADRVFVMTPKGAIIDMVKGATPVDFAYAIHTTIGHRCRGAKVNGVIVPLNYELQNGEQVEILTSKQERPRRDWLVEELDYVKSPRARQRIRQWFSQQNHEQNYVDGEAALERERHLLNLPKLDYAELAQQFGRSNERELVIAVGKGDITQTQLRNMLIRSREPEIRLRKVKSPHKHDNSAIEVRGVKNLYTRIAPCCHPVNGDPIMGYLSQGRGVIVHRADCPNILNLEEERRERLIEVSWSTNTAAYMADIVVSTYNKSGVLGEIANLFAREQINIHSLNTRPTNDPCFSIMDITLEIRDTEQLGYMLEKLMQLSSVLDAQRKG